MISPSTAALAISITRGLIKLGGRLDRLMAEREAATGELILPMPTVEGGLTTVRKKKLLKQLLEEPTEDHPELSAGERRKIKQLLTRAASASQANQKNIADAINSSFAKYFPEEAVAPAIDPDNEYLVKVREFFPSLDLQDENTRLAAFYIRAGASDATIGYAGRTALLVVDVLAEVAAENASQLIHDQRASKVVENILTRFSDPDLEAFNDWSPLLRHALSATLNGLLDSREALDVDDRWVNALLDALTEARADEAVDDDYLLGLLQGQGYRLLISNGLIEASQLLATDEADVFKQITASFLQSSASIVEESSGDFPGFFRDHWSDLINGGMRSLAKHGENLLKAQKPILETTLQAILEELAETDARSYLSHQTLIAVVDAAIGAVATDKTLLPQAVQKEWLSILIGSLVGTIRDESIRGAFSRQGLETIAKDAATAFAARPDLIIANNKLFQEVVGGILESVGGVSKMHAETIASAAVAGALSGIADNPGLLKSDYAVLIAGFAGNVAQLVQKGDLTGVSAEAIVDAGIEAVLENPVLFTRLGDQLSNAIVNAVVEGAKGSEQLLLAGSTLTAIIAELFNAISKHGQSFFPDLDAAGPSQVNELAKHLRELVSAAFARAQEHLGRQMQLSALPKLAGLLTGALAKGQLPSLDPDDPNFQQLFTELLIQVNLQN